MRVFRLKAEATRLRASRFGAAGSVFALMGDFPSPETRAPTKTPSVAN
jgi:hypothetical protein